MLGAALNACSGASSGIPPNHIDPTAQTSTARTAIAQTSSTATDGVALHMPTWAYDEYWGQGENASAATVQEYLSFAQGGMGNDKAVNDCTATAACKSVFYTDPNFIYNQTTNCADTQEAQIESQSTESWYVHEAGYSDKAHRVYGSYSETCNGASVTIPVYALNSYSSGYQTYYRNLLQANADSWDYYFMDDTSGQVLSQLYGPGGGFCHNNPPDDWCETSEEYPTDASVAAAHGAFTSALNHKNGEPMQFFYNGVTFANNQMSYINVLQSSSHFVGAVCEDCVVSSGTFRPTMYTEVLNAMAQVNATPAGAFVELNNGESASGSVAQIEQRLVTAAMFWLGYSYGHSVVFPNLEANTTNLAVWPEYNIVVSDPIESMTTGAANIQVAPGVYRREFAECFNAGVAIGQCAAIVNSSGSTVTISSSWLRDSYAHEIYVTGGDILSGGKIVMDSFTENRTTLAPSMGILIAK